MSTQFNSLDDYEGFITKTIKPWSQQQRTALTAAMAERWLPVYESFSEENEWGDPASFQNAVQAVWKWVLGHPLTPKERKLHQQRVDENTPHMDDFDAYEPIATSAIIHYALNACVSNDNSEYVFMAMVSGLEGVAPGIYTEVEDVPADVWQSPQIKTELKKQLKLLQAIGDMRQIDQQQIDAMHQHLAPPDFVKSVAPQPGPIGGLTNEAVFEQYRRVIEQDLKGKWQWENNLPALGNNAGAVLMMYLGEWLSRYSRRKQAIEQEPMSDALAKRALLARNSAHDAAVQDDPGWDQETRFWIDVLYQNPVNGLDVNSPDQPHSYGPSLRRLWIEGKLADLSQLELLKKVLEWGRWRPPAWEEEDQRKKKRLDYLTPELNERLTGNVSWHATGDVDHPWAAEVAGETWRVRINNFPDDLMYTLLINDSVVGKFHDWPNCWQR